MGSLLFLISWGVLMGPVAYSKSASSPPFSRYTLLASFSLTPTSSPTSYIGPQASVHGSVLWQHRTDAVVLSRGKFTPSLHLTTLGASHNIPHEPCRSSPGMPSFLPQPHAGLIDCPWLEVTDCASA
jgi:hypothetical protein